MTGPGDSSRTSLKWDTARARDPIRSESPAASVLSRSQPPRNLAVAVGSQGRLQYPKGDVVLIRIVKAGSSTPTLSHVSADSPLGTAIMGKRAGEDVVYREMGKVCKFRVLQAI